jgi:hypothetical protein
VNCVIFYRISAGDHGFDCVDVVEHATILYVSDLKEIAHMDVLKASKDTSVLSQVFEI